MAMKKTIALSIAGLMLLSIPAFASDFNAESTTLTITASPKNIDKSVEEVMADNSISPSAIKIEKQLVAGKTTIVKSGQKFSVVLEENASTGYLWTYDVNDKVIKLISQFNKIRNSDDNIVGAPTDKVFTFKALKKGTYKIKFTYERSGEKDIEPADTVEYTVKIK